jgi:hypothetical protein
MGFAEEFLRKGGKARLRRAGLTLLSRFAASAILRRFAPCMREISHTFSETKRDSLTRTPRSAILPDEEVTDGDESSQT